MSKELKKFDSIYNVNYDGIEKSNETLVGLDDEQRVAVLDEGGFSIVIAGPGSGKTKVITHKIAYLISKGVDPKRVLLVTFTKAAANEMIHRAQQVSKDPLSGMMAGTFHHVCNHLLRKYATELKLDPNFSILDEEDSLTIVKHAINEYVERNEKFPSPSVVLKIISMAANTQRSIEKTIDEDFTYFYAFADRINKIKDKYEALKVEQSSLDYDDLLVYANDLLDIQSVRKREASNYLWVLVDEFQDTNKIQYEIIKKLSSVNGNLMVVGDDAQSIYSFRGARYENIIEMSKEKDVKVYKIQTNYRSTPEIVNLVNAMIPNNIFSKTLKPVKANFERPVVVSTWDSLEESAFVSKKINELVNAGISPFQIAVLYRNHSQSMDLQMELSKSKIPFTVRSGVKFTDSKHVKDALSFLRVLVNPKDSLSWMRIFQLFYGIGKKSVEKVVSDEEFKKDPIDFVKHISRFGDKYEKIEEIFKKVSPDDKPNDVLNHVFENFYSDYIAFTFEDRIERQMDIKRVIEIAGRYNDINDFLTDLAITEQIDIDRKERDKEESVTLTTIHRAKGLEWDVVFIISVNPGDFPSSFAITEGKIDEEERVFYVAITRAKKYLFICRQMSGSRTPYYGNRIEINGNKHDFVEKIPPALYDHWKIN
ncbi:MAG: ATP-dependent helicase [Athalassotoga sp.]|uniref:ATP-dependent helicase n=1 Tax=Athalassotoga sp. TaxID=2022597 RepID=UPI003CFBDC55